MSYSSGYQTPGGWSWPDDLPKNEPAQPGSSTTSSRQQPAGTSSGANSSAGSGSQSRRTHWPPRQCRICLETVQPTFNVGSDSLPGFLQSPGVVYQDETGRLIRPCLCKGSSKYVHDACLQAWRHADPGYGKRNYWQCPTCGFKYRLARLGAGRFVGSVGKSNRPEITYHLSSEANTPCSCSDRAHCSNSHCDHLRSRICSRPYHWALCRPMELHALEQLVKT
jgi:hypothetical protein